MAKYKFEDYANGAMAVVGVIMMCQSAYKTYMLEQDAKQRRAADRFVNESEARMRAMHDHILKNRGSKEAYVQAFTAAKNVIAFDAMEELPGSAYQLQAVKELNEFIDKLIAKV